MRDQAQRNAALNAAPRVVAGGDLTKGWVLRRGTAMYASPATTTKTDPFASTVDLPLGERPRTSRSVLAPPPHIVPWAGRMPFANFWESAPLARFPFPLRTRATVKTLLIMVIYLVFTITACTYKSNLGPKAKGSGYGEDFMRTGVVAMSQVPLAIALGVRGNIIGMLLGQSYENLRIFHKVVGRVMFTTSALHSIFYFVKWGKSGQLLKRTMSPVGLTGTIAFAATCLIVVTSLPRFRRSAYGVFKVSHYIGIVMLLAGMGAHVPSAVPWAIASGAIYMVSIAISMLKTRVTQAELIALSGNATTMVTLPNITTGWRAGQHVRLRVVGLDGFLHKMECHPFTIASAPDSGGLVLMAKVAGDWTRELYDLATKGGHRVDAEANGGVWSPRRATVIVEGPYGGLGNTLPTSFSSLLLVAGGSGITYSLALAQDLIARSPSGVVAARTIDLVWIIRVEQTAKVIMPTMNNLVTQARQWEEQALKMRKAGADVAYPTALRIHIFVTRVPASSPLRLLDDSPDFSKVEKVAMEDKLFPASAPTSSLGHGSDESSSDGHGIESSDGHAPYVDGDWRSPYPQGTYINAERASPYSTQNPSVNTLNASESTLNIAARARAETPAERTRADWLQRNPSTAAVARLHERNTNPKKTMSSISAYRGRPDFRSVLNTITDETMARHGRQFSAPTGILVHACGPEFLVNDTRDAVHSVSQFKAKACGGIEFADEFFGI